MHDDGTIIRGHDSDLEEIAGVVGPDEHDQPFIEIFDVTRVAERVEDGFVAHAVFAVTRRDDGLLHEHKLACYLGVCKLTCESSSSARHVPR